MIYFARDRAGNPLLVNDAPYRTPKSGGAGSGACCTPKIEIFDVTTQVTLPAPSYSSDLVFYRVNLPMAGTVQAPASGGVQPKQQIYILNTSAASLLTINSTLGEGINQKTGSWSTIPPRQGVHLRKRTDGVGGYFGIQGIAPP